MHGDEKRYKRLQPAVSPSHLISLRLHTHLSSTHHSPPSLLITDTMVTTASILILMLSASSVWSAATTMTESTIGTTERMSADEPMVQQSELDGLTIPVMGGNAGQTVDQSGNEMEILTTDITDVSTESTVPVMELPDLTSLTGFNSVTGLVDMVEAFAERIRRETMVPGSQAARFKKLMRLIEAGKLQDCAGRVVCDLNCDANAFGSDGRRVLQTLTRLQTSGFIERRDMDFYVRAGVMGRKNSGHKECQQICLKSYPVCPAQSKDLIAVASLIKLRF